MRRSRPGKIESLFTEAGQVSARASRIAAWLGARVPAQIADGVGLEAAGAGQAYTDHRHALAHWTGIYLGLNGGFTFGASNWTDSVTASSTGNFGNSEFVFGGTVGANYQIGSLGVRRRGRRRLGRCQGAGAGSSCAPILKASLQHKIRCNAPILTQPPSRLGCRPAPAVSPGAD